MRRSVPWLWLLLLVGFLVRLWAMRWPPFSYDMVSWIAWGERMREVGPQRFYDPSVFSDYAPGYLYVLWLTATIKQTFFPDGGESIYHFLYRLPPVVCDLLTAGLIYNVLAREGQGNQGAAVQPSLVSVPLIGAALHLFNPLVIINSTVWAQIDATFSLAMLLTLVLALRGHAVGAVLTYVVAFLIKPQAIGLAPVLAILLLLRYPWRRWLVAGLAGVALGFVVIVPFLGWRSYLGLVEILRQSIEVYPYTSMFSYNLWGMSGFWEDDRVASLVGISLRSFGTLLYLLGIGYGTWVLVRALRRGADPVLAGFASASYFVFLPVMVLTRMHERYLYPLFPFLLVFALLLLSRRRDAYPASTDVTRPSGWRWLPLGLYLVLSVLHAFNLYQVYTYYRYYDTGGVPADNWLFYFIEPQGRLWSGLTMAAFMVVALALPWWNRAWQRARIASRLAAKRRV